MNTRIILSILLSCFIYSHDVGASGYLGPSHPVELCFRLLLLITPAPTRGS